MRFDDIAVKFIEGTEVPYDKNPNIHRIEAENLETMKFCPVCGAFLKKKSRTKRSLYDYRTSPFTGEARIFLVKLISQRYVCTAPACKSSFTAGLLDSSRNSRAFSRYVVEKLLSKTRLSYSLVAQELNVSHTFISGVVNDYIKESNLHYSPSRFCKYLYLHEFIYQNKPRYALINVNNMNEKHLIGLFGHEDRKKELADYLRFHLKDDGTWFTIATENAEELESSFEPFPGQIFFVESKKGRDNKLEDEYAYMTRTGAHIHYSPYIDELRKITGFLTKPKPQKHLKEWMDSYLKTGYKSDTKKQMEGLVRRLLDDSRYVYEYGIYTANFKEYEEYIKEYNRKNIPFEKLCLYLMHIDQQQEMFKDGSSDELLYDEHGDTLYRPAPLEDVEKLKEDAHRRFELYKEEAEIYDTFDLFEPEDVDLCDDPSELPEDVIQEMASNAPDISEDVLYYIQQFLDD